MGRVLVVVLAIYGILKFEDLYHRGVLHLVFVPGYEQGFFLLEMALSVVFPLLLLASPKVRDSAKGLYLVAVLTLLGFVTNRLNVAITGVESAVGGRYTPKWTEVVITAMFVALGFALFGFAARYLPIFPEEKSHEPVAAEAEWRARRNAGACPCRRLTNPKAKVRKPAWLVELGRSISAKLMVSILLAGLMIFALLGYLSNRLHRKHLEEAALVSAEQQSEVLRRSASHYMLNNDRNGLYEMMANMADQPGIVRVRILNSEGVISYSTLTSEVGAHGQQGRRSMLRLSRAIPAADLLKRSDRFPHLSQRRAAVFSASLLPSRTSLVRQRCLPRSSCQRPDSRRARHQPLA